MSRAIGEAAPILVVCGAVYINFAPENLMSDFTTMPLQIYDWASRPHKEFHGLASAAIIVLLGQLVKERQLSAAVVEEPAKHRRKEGREGEQGALNRD